MFVLYELLLRWPVHSQGRDKNLVFAQRGGADPKHSVLTRAMSRLRTAGSPAQHLQSATSLSGSSCASQSLLKATEIPKTRQEQATESRAQPSDNDGEKNGL